MAITKALNILVFGVILFCCTSNTEDITTKLEDIQEQEDTNTFKNDTLKIIALGDSYTIGESVCSSCKFPEQLKDSIANIISDVTIELTVIAKTGWTTSALKNALEAETLAEDYDIATLLIGVNNQFQRRPFELFEKEFPELVTKAVTYAGGKAKNLIVISIPDYAFTPFGNGNLNISNGINTYNTFIKNYCDANNITYVFITDITRQGIENPSLVANDGLHPSTLAYSKFVSRLLPEALEKIGYNTD